MGKWTRRLLIAAPFLLVAGVIGAPFLSADKFKDQIRVNLEQLLHRKVEVQGDARFQLYPRPGVSLSRVVIHELPELGVEPIAYLDYPESSLDVSLAPFSLFLGRVKVTGVRLVAPSLNLTKSANGVWTFQALLDQALGAGRAAGFELDALEVQGGRLNIKIGNVKSVFYLADTDLRIEADSSDRSRYGITIAGDPARTDRTVSSFGRITGRGMLTLAGKPQQEPSINLNLSIERTPIAELVTAFQGRNAGLGGFIASQAQLKGPLSAVAIEGRIDLNEADRFGWLLPRAASARGFAYTGELNWVGQELRLQTRDTEATAGPVSLRMRATDLFQQPRWATLLSIRRAPLASARALAGELGITVPETVPVEGSLSGVLGYSSRHGTRGQVAIDEAAMPVPSLPSAVRVETARVLVDNDRWRVPAAELRFSEREAATVEMGGEAGSGARQLTVTTAGIAVERSRQLWRFLAGEAEPPFFDRCRQGQWAGTLAFEQDRKGGGLWSGDVRVTGTSCALDGVTEAALVDSAQLAIRGSLLQARRLTARMGSRVITGEIDYDPRLRRHTKLRLALGDWTAASFEALLLPALRRERGSFLSRTLGRRTVSLPEWLAQRRLDAQLKMTSLTIAEQKLENLTVTLAWDGAMIELPRISGTFAGGSFTGHARISTAESEPAYRGHFDTTGITLRDSKLEANVDWETAGLGAARLAPALRMQGRFSAHGNPLAASTAAAEVVCDSATGAFSFSALRLHFPTLQVTGAGGESWQGAASIAPDGNLQWEGAGSGESARGVKLAGRLW